MYKPRAVEMQKRAQGQFLVAHVEAAVAKMAAKDCDEARREAELVLGIDAKNKRAAFVVKRCEAMAAKPEPAPRPERVAAAPKPAPRRPAPASAPAPVTARPAAARPVAARPGESAKLEPAADADKLIKDAQQAWLRGQHAVAIDAARKALRVKPNLTNAYQIIAICSCALHDADSAAKAYEKLDERNKLYVKSSCQKNGISF
jgi:tetratricopeptide (TPR) repeat protein